MQIDVFVRRARARARAARYQGLPAVLLALALAGCGGNGGDTPPGPNPVDTEPEAPGTVGAKTLSGVITVGDSLVADSDSNDPNNGSYRSNSEWAAAQTLATPVTVLGSVNEAGTGDPGGKNYRNGDVDDWFKVRLAAGQVVELLVATAEGGKNDADLCIGSLVDGKTGCSTSETQRECVRAGVEGDYLVLVNAYAGASVYNLRISSPGQGGTCDIEVQPTTAGATGGILARPATAGEMRSLSGKNARMSVPVKQVMGASGVQVKLASTALNIEHIQMPSQGLARAQALKTLEIVGKGLTLSQARTKAFNEARADEPEVLGNMRLYQYAKSLVASGEYAWAHPQHVSSLYSRPVGPFPPPDEGYIAQRWHYEQIGLPAAMQYLGAMNPQPTQRPLVAVIDSGLMYEHPDFQGQVSSEGRTFASVHRVGDGDKADAKTTARAITDQNYHGSHVAGTVAAATFDSGKGSMGAGVAPMAQILPINVAGLGDVDILEAIMYASGYDNRTGQKVTRRADVINLSLGWKGQCPPSYQEAINAARAAGVMVVAATGNDASNNQGRKVGVGAPANCQGVFPVTATEAQRKLADYANTGPELAFAAPGGDDRLSTNGSGYNDGVWSAVGDVRNGNLIPVMVGWRGTSMASPHAAGVLALMRWVHPAITEAQVRQALQAGQLTDDLGSPGKDDSFGWGLINARKAVEVAFNLKNGGAAPPATASPIVASPQALDFGTQTQTLQFSLTTSGSSTQEKVLSITSSSPAVTVSPGVTGTGLGTYTVSADRNKLAEGSHFPTLTVQLQPARTLTIQLSVSKLAAGSAAGRGDVGPIYVLLIDPATEKVVKTALAVRQQGQYTWSTSAYEPAKVIVLAGTDLDNDGFVCRVGEACGAYPTFGSLEGMTVTLSGDRKDLNFSVAAATGTSTASVSEDRAEAFARVRP